ncbi:hypothetical protein QWZ00_17355 [Belliella kenyensis]|nr:hypothetical protein [Belliella kenyensis]MDN3604884.1 hypothetical protein [Belliella kenyensis]
METFLVNETDENVLFDDFSIMSLSRPIVQETHYSLSRKQSASGTLGDWNLLDLVFRQVG